MCIHYMQLLYFSYYNSTVILVLLLVLYFQYKSQGVTTVIASPLNMCLNVEVFSFFVKRNHGQSFIVVKGY